MAPLPFTGPSEAAQQRLGERFETPFTSALAHRSKSQGRDTTRMLRPRVALRSTRASYADAARYGGQCQLPRLILLGWHALR
jgi:hypothetical protein